MEETVYNPQKGRLENIEVEYAKDSTTWFDNYVANEDIYVITYYKGGILIKECNCTYPVWVYDLTRDQIGNDQKKAKGIRAQYVQSWIKDKRIKRLEAGYTPVALRAPYVSSAKLQDIYYGNGNPGILIVVDWKNS